MQELLGQILLFLCALANGGAVLVAWQLYGRYPTLEHGLVLSFALSHAYGALTLLVGAGMPLRVVYERPDLLEMMHRSRYLIFDCAAVPCVLWLLVALLHRFRAELGWGGSATMGLMDAPFSVATLVALGAAHAALSFLAASDCSKYPMTPENCLGVLYWRPTRFTSRMKLPWLCVTRALWALALLRIVLQGRAWLFFATAFLRLAYHGHMSHWQHWPWEIFVQPFAAVALTAALLSALSVGVQCNWRTLDPSTCLVTAPGGAVPLLNFGSGARLRF